MSDHDPSNVPKPESQAADAAASADSGDDDEFHDARFPAEEEAVSIDRPGVFSSIKRVMPTC